MSDLPVSIEAFATLVGVAAFGALVTQWLKRYVKVDLVVNVVTLIICEAAAVVAALIQAQWQPTAAGMFTAAILGFVGATLACFGYEVVKNAVELVKPK